MGQLQVVMENASRITGRPELIPDPIFSKLASVRQSEIGSGIRLSYGV